MYTMASYQEDTTETLLIHIEAQTKCYTQKVFLHPCPSFYCNNQFLGFYHFSCWDILCKIFFSRQALARLSFPGPRFLKGPVTFWARRQILKSKPV